MFSGTVKLLDLNDYIKPGEECVVMIKQNETADNNGKGKKATIGFDDLDIRPDLIKTNTSNKAKISINDCLACSGCITSSEALLVEEQSAKKFLESYLEFKKRFALVTPQSLASLASKLGIPDERALVLLDKLFKEKYGFDFVMDIGLFIEIANEMAYKEYLENQSELIFSSECPGWICYLEKVLGTKFVPYASKVKTPQLFGAEMIKNAMAYVDGVVR